LASANGKGEPNDSNHCPYSNFEEVSGAGIFQLQTKVSAELKQRKKVDTRVREIAGSGSHDLPLRIVNRTKIDGKEFDIQ
jgi:hypothetical protein